MQILINTDHNIKGHETYIAQLISTIKNAMSRISDDITRLEVHLSDENSGKSGQNDKRCMMEARLERRQPVAVTHQDGTVDKAVDGAIDKLISMIETILGKQRDLKRNRTNLPHSE